MHEQMCESILGASTEPAALKAAALHLNLLRAMQHA